MRSVTADYANAWNRYMNKFGQEYLECQKQWEQQGLKVKSLECIKHVQVSDTPTATVNPRYIN